MLFLKFHMRVCYKFSLLKKTSLLYLLKPTVYASGAGARGFDPQPGHTKYFKNGSNGAQSCEVSIMTESLVSG